MPSNTRRNVTRGKAESGQPQDGEEVVGSPRAVDRNAIGAAPVDAGPALSLGLSPMQAGMLYQAVLDGPRSARGFDVEQVCLDFNERLNPDLLALAFNDAVGRHDALRARFLWRDVPSPQQEFVKIVTVPVTVTSWVESEPADEATSIAELLKLDRQRGFDVAEAPLMRVTLCERTQGTFLLWTCHHMILDGRSFAPVLTEVFEAYFALLAGSSVTKRGEGRSYGLYLRWLAERDPKPSIRYFEENLGDVDKPTPLPLKGARSGRDDTGYGEHRRWLPDEVLAAVHRCADATGTTSGTVIQAAWALVLGRYSGERDVLFGMARACRKSALDGAGQDTVGLFVNTLPCRVQLSPTLTVRQLLETIRSKSMELRSHEHTSLIDIQAATRVPRGTPLFDTMVMFDTQELFETLHAHPVFSALQGATVHEQPAVPLTLTVFATTRLLVRFLYDREQVGEHAIERLSEALEVTLRDLCADSRRLVDDVEVTSVAERERILSGWNSTSHAFPRDTLIHQLFESRADRQPDSRALEVFDQALTYRQLEESANQLAQALQARGLQPGDRVGICCERNVGLIVSLLGVSKAGCVYVPLDPTHPVERLSFLLQDANLRIVVSDSKTIASLPEGTVVLLTCGDEVRGSSTERPAISVPPTADCYVIYTSGSTGTPKGVVMTHRAVVNTLDWVIRTFEFSEADRLLFVTSACFDLSVFDVFGVLGSGGTVVVANESLLSDPVELTRAIEDKAITVWDSAPAALQRLSPYFQSIVEGRTLRLVMLSGDWIPLSLPGAVWETFPNAAVMSLGGATEAAIWSNWYPVWGIEPTWASVPYGRPIQNCRYHVLDNRLRPVPVGVAGDLYIGGVCLARCYLERPELTAERFIPDPFLGADERLYRTGDLARYFDDGELEFLGRSDFQVKIRGYRVELGEVEAELLLRSDIKQAVCTTHTDASNQKVIVAYVVLSSSKPVHSESIREELSHRLPDYMVPGHIVALQEMPVTSNGKLDRKALPLPVAQSEQSAFVPARSPEEAAMVAIWEELLNVKPVSASADFFAHGGHSLLAVMMASRIKTTFGVEIPVSRILQTPRLNELTASLKEPSLIQSQGALVALRPQTGSRSSFFFIHDGDGETLLYRNLASRLPAGMDAYGIIPKASGRLQMAHSTIDEMAHWYAEQIVERQAQGPYLLGGLCAGGLIAFETARVLRKQGRTVGMLLLLEAANPRTPKRSFKIAGDRYRSTVNFISEAKGNTRRIGSVLFARATRAARYEAGRLAKSVVSDVRFSMLQHLEWFPDEQWPASVSPPTVREIYEHASARYTPNRLTCEMALLVRATTPGEGGPLMSEIYQDHMLGWSDLVDGVLEDVDVPGGHGQMLQEPFVAAVSKYVVEALNRSNLAL
jgi:amino acid adenylation domain-containing protein